MCPSHSWGSNACRLLLGIPSTTYDLFGSEDVVISVLAVGAKSQTLTSCNKL